MSGRLAVRFSDGVRGAPTTPSPLYNPSTCGHTLQRIAYIVVIYCMQSGARRSSCRSAQP